MRENWRALGPPANVSGVRHDALLRRLAEPPRHQARAGEQASRDRIGRGGGELVVLLSGRCLCGVLNQAEFESDVGETPDEHQFDFIDSSEVNRKCLKMERTIEVRHVSLEKDADFELNG